MTPGDVIDELIGMRGPPLLSREEPDDQGVAILVWSALVKQLKPDQAHMPFSPEERQRAKRVLKALLDAIDIAKARKPAHVRPVEPGGR